MTSILYWLVWLFSLLATGMLLVWHLPFYPFSDSGARANEGAVLFMLLAFVRWFATGFLIVVITVLWMRRSGASAWLQMVVPVVMVALHVLLGLVNLGVWDAWLSAGKPHTPEGDKLLATVYFALPGGVLLLLAVAKLLLPMTPEPPPVIAPPPTPHGTHAR